MATQQPSVTPITHQPAAVGGREVPLATFRVSLRSPTFWRRFVSTLGMYVIFTWVRHRLRLTNRVAYSTVGGYLASGKDRDKDLMPFEQIRNAATSDSLITQLLGYGTLKITVSGDSADSFFENLAGASLVSDLIADARPDATIDRVSTRMRLYVYQRRSAISNILILFVALWVPFWIAATLWMGLSGLIVAVIVSIGAAILAILIAP